MYRTSLLLTVVSLRTILLHPCCALTGEKRISRLLPWVSDDKNACCGWAVEHREPGSLRVTVGWGSTVGAQSDSLTVSLPSMPTNGLATSLWPPALAAACLLNSPSAREFLNNKSVLELGCGLGLAGLVAADSATSCNLTDNDETVIQLLQQQQKGNVAASVLEWRDEARSTDIQPVDMVLGTAVAYYYYLLRHLMDTTQTFLKPRDSVFLVVGQANRESQWELYHNILDGCYNQLTDETEEPWPGSTRMLLYRLEMSHWVTSTNDNDLATDEREKMVDGVIPIAALLHQSPTSKEQISHLSDFDYVATTDDEDSQQMTF